MADDYSDAIYTLEQSVERACVCAEEHLTQAEIVAELRRIADEMEKNR